MPNIIASMKGLIEYQGKYLFLKEPLHHGDIWDLPGGKVEYGEEPLDTLKREVKEEVFFEIEIVKPLGVWWFYSQTNKHQVICNTYLCRPTGEPKIDLTQNPADEHFTEYRWLTKEEVLHNPEYQITNSLRKLLETITP